MWAPPDVSQCENVLFGMLRITVSAIWGYISCECIKLVTSTCIYHRVNWPNTLLNMGVHTSHTPDSMIPWRTALLNFLLNLQAEDFYSNVTVVDEATLAMALDIVSELAIYTDPTSISIFPRDLNTSNYVITNTVDLLLLSLEQGGTTDITAVCSLLRQ